MHRRLTVFVLLTLTIFLSRASAEASGQTGPQFTVSVYNDAGVPAAVLDRAEQRSGSIFARANLEVVWLNCTQASTEDALVCNQIDLPGHLALRIIPHAASSMSDAAFGVAFLSPDGAGKYADVFWTRAEDLQVTSNLDLGGLLGSVMAHELGHLLIGSNAHAVSGIMRARWEGEELRRIAMGNLLFTAQQAKLMHAKARLRESAEHSVEPQTTEQLGLETSNLREAPSRLF